ESCENLQKAKDEAIDATKDIDEELAKTLWHVLNDKFNMLSAGDLFKYFKELIEKESSIEN
ncbi:hypothetical protein KI387_037966, partial [Taxus chinensis]